MSDLRGRRAVVTGASSGIGAALARQLAERGCALVITARRKERLDRLADELRDAHGVDVDVVALDLGAPGGAGELWTVVTRGGQPVDILINNAGFGVNKAFTDASWERLATMIQLNMTALVELSHRFVEAALERPERPAHLLNVASIGAYQPVPYFAVYAATKSFVRNFTEALSFELRRSHVHATCLNPGGTRTEFMEVADNQLKPFAEKTLMSAEDCAAIGVKAMLKGRANVVSGVMNKVSCWLTRLTSHRMSARAAYWVIGEPSKE